MTSSHKKIREEMCCNVSLKCKVLTIAIGCILFYVFSVSLQICIISNKNIEKTFHKNRDIVFYNNIDFGIFYYIVICVIILCFCGLTTCVILIFGVFKMRRKLILPFMIFTETILACAIVVELICDIIQPLYGLFLLFFIPPIVYTVVTTRAFYHEISKSISSFRPPPNIEEQSSTIRREMTPTNSILKRY